MTSKMVLVAQTPVHLPALAPALAPVELEPAQALAPRWVL